MYLLVYEYGARIIVLCTLNECLVLVLIYILDSLHLIYSSIQV
jgi:hypothetical protein